MIDLDSSRTTANEIKGKISNCDVDHNIGVKNVIDIASTSGTTQSPTRNCQDGNSNIHKTDQEDGWSTVGPKKRKKKNKK